MKYLDRVLLDLVGGRGVEAAGASCWQRKAQLPTNKISWLAQ